MKTAKRKVSTRHFLFAVALTVSVGGQADGAVMEANDSDTLKKMEDKLFGHDYRNDSELVRIDRLEKFVYGDIQNGSEAHRLANLSTVSAEFKAKKATPVAVAAKPSPLQAAPSPAAQPKPVPSTSFDYNNYPRVAELEKHMLGNTYATDALPERLSRLETKAFGKPSSAADLGQRVDALDAYADRHDIYHERMAPVDELAQQTSPLDIASRASAAVQNPFLNGAPGPDDSKDRLSIMEGMVFGHAYDSRSEAERLERLEKKLVPYEHNNAQKDVTTRVNSLWNILKVANTMNGAPLSTRNNDLIATNPPQTQPNQRIAGDDSAGNAQSNGHKSWLHGLGKYLGSDSNSPGLTQMGFPGASMPGTPYLPGTPRQTGATWGF